MANHSDTKSGTKLALPFAVSAQNRIKDFTEDMEMAAVLYWAESNREKGEGYIFKKPDEKLVFVTKAAYPMWLVPWTKGILVFDGLGVTKHALTYDALPDVNAFNRDITENARTSEAYLTSLSRNSNYFENFTAREEKTIESLVAAPDFLQDFRMYLAETGSAKKPSITRAILSSIIEQTEISASIGELSWLVTKTSEDVESIDASMKLLNKTTKEKTGAIREEIKEIRRKRGKQIEKAKSIAGRKTRQIQDRYDRKITKALRRFKRRLQLLNKNRVKYRKMQRHLTAEAKRCEAKIASSKRRKRKRSEIQWSLRLKRIKAKLPVLAENIKKTEKDISSLEATKALRISQQRLECEASIEKATAILRELEASREAEVIMRRQEMTSLEQATAQITSQMKEMAKSKKAALNEIDKVSMATRKKAGALVYLPFYLARYEKEGKQRYLVYPPSIVGDMGIVTRMKGALGAAKMKEFLQPRSKAMTAFLNQLEPLLQQNPMLENEVTEAGIQESVLRIKELRMGVKRGLEELEKEQWISRNELEDFSKLLYIYA